jgi:hypothetical protein
VLVRLDLTPLTTPPRGNWKQTWQQCLETLRRCVYLDKDLVLPPMGTSGTSETFFVVASTDMPQSGIMTARIREQMDRVPDLKTKCALTIMAAPIDLPGSISGQALEQQIQTLADEVNTMITTSMQRKHSHPQKSQQDAN